MAELSDEELKQWLRRLVEKGYLTAGGELLSSPPPPAGLAERLLADVIESRKPLADEGIVVKPSRPGWPWGWYAATAVLLLAVSGVVVWLVLQRDTRPPDAPPPDADELPCVILAPRPPKSVAGPDSPVPMIGPHAATRDVRLTRKAGPVGSLDATLRVGAAKTGLLIDAGCQLEKAPTRFLEYEFGPADKPAVRGYMLLKWDDETRRWYAHRVVPFAELAGWREEDGVEVRFVRRNALAPVFVGQLRNWVLESGRVAEADLDAALSTDP